MYFVGYVHLRRCMPTECGCTIYSFRCFALYLRYNTLFWDFWVKEHEIFVCTVLCMFFVGSSGRELLTTPGELIRFLVYYNTNSVSGTVH